MEESIVGPLLPAIGAARTLSPLDFLVPAAIVLMGLAVARGNWSLASAATVALLASTVIVVVMFVRNVGFYVVDERGMWWSLQSILATVEGLLATGAAVALTASLLRARRTTPAP